MGCEGAPALVEVTTVTSDVEAETLAALLRGEGVQVVLFGSGSGAGLGGRDVVHGVRVMVADVDLGRARATLEGRDGGRPARRRRAVG